MKTSTAWLDDWHGGNPHSVLTLIQRVQSDALHEGIIFGLIEARNIIKGLDQSTEELQKRIDAVLLEYFPERKPCPDCITHEPVSPPSN